MAKKKQKATSGLWLILLGEEWTGKSSAGNTILDQTVFSVDSDTEHVTQSFGVIEGRNVTVVDTLGWAAECSPDVPLKMLKKGHSSASSTCPGFHILLLTIPISQDKEWNQKVAQRLLNALRLFNDDVWKHTMLLFTRSDLLNSTGLEGYLTGSGQPFQSLMEKCEGRFHVLNNHKQNDCKQVRELLEKIEQMVQENNGQLLQLVTSEQEVGTLSKHEMDNRQLVERYSKMEGSFRLEDFMFKSLRPQDNDPPNIAEQSEPSEENSLYDLRSKGEMWHPVDVQDATLEHIQEEDTESTSDCCSESPAEINRDLAMSGGDDGDNKTSDVDQTEKNICTEVEETGMHQIPGDEEKNNKYLKHSILQRNAPQPWDNSWDLSITYYFYKDISSKQCVMMTCVLQISVYWRKMKCQTDWISFTMCGENINWLVLMVLYLFVRYLCLIYKIYEVSRETDEQTMNMLVSGFVECQQDPSKENQGTFDSLLQQMGNNRPKSLDEKINQCSKMEADEKTLQHSTGGKDDEMSKGDDDKLPQHIQKSEAVEDDDEEEITQQNKTGDEGELPKHIHKGEEVNEDEEEIAQKSKKGDDEELPQHKIEAEEVIPQHIHKGEEEGEWKASNEEIPHQSNDDHTLQHSLKEDEKQMLQTNKSNYGETDQQSNAVEGAEILKLKRIDDDIFQYSNRHGGVKKKYQMTKMFDYEKTPKHSKKGHNSKGDYEEIPLQSKRLKDEEISKHIFKVMEEIHGKRGSKKAIRQYNRRGGEKKRLQHNTRDDKKEIPQNDRRVYEELILQCNRLGGDKEIPQHNWGRNDDEIPKRSRRTDNEEVHKRKGDDGDIYHHWKSAHDHEKIPRHSRSGLDDEIPQRNKREDGEEIPHHSRKREKDKIPQHSRKENEKEIPQHTSVGDDEEIKAAPEQEVEGIVKIKSANKNIHHKWRRNQLTKDVSNFADANDEEKNTNQIRQVARRQQSPEARAESSSKLNHKAVFPGIRRAEMQLDKRRVEFGGSQKIMRSQSMDLLVNLRYAGEEDMRRQTRKTRKTRRTKSLERFIVFNRKEDKTAENKHLLKTL